MLRAFFIKWKAQCEWHPRENSLHFIYLYIFKHYYFLLLCTLIDILLRENCFLIASFIYCAKMHYFQHKKIWEGLSHEFNNLENYLKPYLFKWTFIYCRRLSHFSFSLKAPILQMLHYPFFIQSASVWGPKSHKVLFSTGPTQKGG